MNTIPLSELQMYLAYGLTGQAYITYTPENSRWVDCDLLCLFIDDYLTAQCRDFNGEKWDTVTKVSRQNFRPAVLPLTSLTEEDWVEVFKAGFANAGSGTQGFLSDKVDVSVLHYGIFLKYVDSKMEANYDPINKNFCCEPYAFNSIAAFQKLFSLHADVFGWISAGTGINKLTYGKK